MTAERRNKWDFYGGIITATGIVIPAEWDEHGNPSAIAFSTYDEEEYLIDDKNENGKALQRFIREKVRVTGIVGKEVNKRRMITVENYILLEDVCFE